MKSTPDIKKKIKRSIPTKKQKEKPFPVVAIGASAGGLDAISILLKNLSPKTGMAFIFVQHLSPTHKSFLTSILSKVTKMKVQEIEDMEHMVPNNVYVIPNDKGIEVTDGHIKLIPRSKVATPISVDILFSSLAQTHKENVIGIILSGNAHDGTEGLMAIKEAGGVTFAQDQSAQAHSMPKSAIASGMVDYVLSPKEIALELIRISNNGSIKHLKKYVGKEVDVENVIKDNDPDLKIILEILHKNIHVDFSRYKMATIKRRISHQMLQSGTNTIKEYVRLLNKKKNEIDLLYKDLLINVTSFFRDAESFHYLKSKLLPKLLKDKKTNEMLRIWIPACSTGEEAYTIAMLINELQDNKTKKIPIQIFATDLSDDVVRSARIGEYSENDLKSIGKRRLKRFFTKSGDNYRIVKELREMCVFASHNILHDPPFSRIDFVSCRNLLIYFDTPAQKKALSTIAFALNDGGYLMLGKSETTGTASQLFTQVDNKFRIYSRKKSIGVRKIPDINPSFIKKSAYEKYTKTASKKIAAIDSLSFDNIIDATLLSSYMPACAIINKDMEILKFRGSTSTFLSHQSGKASLNILKMMRPEFAFELRNAIHKATDTNKPVHKSGIELNTDDSESSLKIMSLEVRPLKIEWDEPLLLIVFNLHEQIKYAENDKAINHSSLRKDLRIKKQAEELKNARAEMLTVFESQEKAYEDLQTANEEIISASEEFQTLNEELETSKEEIEAANEELQTTNQELQIRNEQLAEAFSFSEALAETMHEPMLILDTHLRIKSVNKAFYKKFRVLKIGTEGKLLYELGNHQWNIPRLKELLENIVQKGTNFNDYEIVHEFPDIGKKTMLLNARRIIQKTQQEQLILLTFIDTTEYTQKRKAEKKDLEDLINERTIELEESYNSLKDQNVFLQKMNKELETFTFISSHDLQEPLRKIQNFTNLLLENEYKNISDTGKDYLQRMQVTVKRMQMLITDLLAYSRVGKEGHEFKKINLNKIVEEVIAEFQESLNEKKGIIQVDGFCNAKVIGFQFRELLYNLISNALKFSHPKRYPRIIIKSKITPGSVLKYDNILPGINYCHLTFIDNGIGFDPKYKDRIFEVFQRLHGQSEYKGTGIGLAICKRIVENHNGVITATGRLGKGAQFDIYIPIE